MGPTLSDYALLGGQAAALFELSELEKSRLKGKMRSGHPGSKKHHGETARIKKIAKTSRKRNRR